MRDLTHFLKGILPAHHSFQCGESPIWFQIGLFPSVDVTRSYLERKRLCWKQVHLAHCEIVSTVRLQLFLERNTSYN
jgi:hypothetical protein